MSQVEDHVMKPKGGREETTQKSNIVAISDVGKRLVSNIYYSLVVDDLFCKFLFIFILCVLSGLGNLLKLIGHMPVGKERTHQVLRICFLDISLALFNCKCI